LVPVLACLAHEDDLVDTALLVAEEELADLVGRADRAPEAAEATLHDFGAESVGVRRRRVHGAGVEALLPPLMLVLGPHVGDAGLMATEDVVVRQGVPEEVGTLEAALHRLVLVGVAHERRDAREVGVDGVTDGYALALERPVVVADPVTRVLRVD